MGDGCWVLVTVRHLTAIPRFLQSREHGMHEIMFAGICPAVHQIILPHVGIIHETVVVVVHILQTVFIMKQQSGGESFAKVNACIGISLYSLVVVSIQLCINTVYALAIEESHVYLSCYALVSVLHRTCSLAHLYAAHPCTRNISQGIRSGKPAIVRDIVSHHLHIASRQTE